MIREEKILEKMRNRKPVFVVDIYCIIRDVYIENVSFTKNNYNIKTKDKDIIYNCSTVFSSRYQAILSVIYKTLEH